MMIFAFDSIRVLDGDVTLSVNGQLKALKMNSVMELDECDTVSFISGPGKLRVKNFIFSERAPNKTYKTICKENYFSKLTGQLLAYNESSKSGVSMRNMSTAKASSEYYIKKPVDNGMVNEKYFYFSKDVLVLNTQMFRAKKILIKIQNSDENLHILDFDVNGESVIKINAEIIKKKCIVVVENAETNEKLLSIYID